MQSSKASLRATFKAARAVQTAVQKREIDKAIAQRVLTWDVYLAARIVFLYVSMPQEIDTKEILEHALACGKVVCVPRCGAHGQMTAHRISTRQQLQPRGAFGILEPEESAMIVAPNAMDLVLAPALACDWRGWRLGYGGGYYDRFLLQVTGHCAALCAESRLVDRLPHDVHDVSCKTIITERQMVHV